MTAEELLDSNYYFLVGTVLAIISLWIHIHTNRGDKDILLDFIAIGMAVHFIIAWPLLLLVGIAAGIIVGVMTILATILYKIRTK